MFNEHCNFTLEIKMSNCMFDNMLQNYEHKIQTIKNKGTFFSPVVSINCSAQNVRNMRDIQ